MWRVRRWWRRCLSLARSPFATATATTTIKRPVDLYLLVIFRIPLDFAAGSATCQQQQRLIVKENKCAFYFIYSSAIFLDRD